MNHSTYLFYDLETTGSNKCFDQVLQFAAIRTDLELNELERHEIQIKLNCDVIPHPEAILVHRIPINTMLQGEAEVTAMLKIHALLNTPGTLSGGYNTLGFDDEFLRFCFHRNLLPPYTHQWANNCGRFDLYPITQLYFIYRQASLNWPTNNTGNISLKLEHLNTANQLADGNAHNAMVDVEATLALARRFFNDRDMWNYSLGYFEKDTDLRRRLRLDTVLESPNHNHQLALMIGESGSSDNFQCPVLSLGQHNHYKNQTLWLRLDKTELTTTTVDTLPKTTWAIRKRAGEPGFLLPFQPRFTTHLISERQQIMQDNLHWLRSNATLFADIQQHHRNYKYPEVTNVDVDADLYTAGFLAPNEERLCAQFHIVPPEKKATIAAQFQNPRLQEIAIRILGRHCPHYLSNDMTTRFADYMQAVKSNNATDMPIDYRGNRRLTSSAALAKLQEIKGTMALDAEQLRLLQELEDYLCDR